MQRMKRIWFWLGLMTVPISAGTAGFKDAGQSLNAWQIQDLAGDASVKLVSDSSIPAPYGPQSIEISGANVCLVAKNHLLNEGILVVLWKVMDPPENSANGGLLFRGDFPENWRKLPTAKRVGQYYWLEQDNDTGCQIRCQEERQSPVTLVERPGLGLVSDSSWNPIGWFWQKITIRGDSVFAKFWSAIETEPPGWMLQTKLKPESGQQFGVRIESGRVRIAYFQAGQTEFSIKPPPGYLFVNYHSSFPNQSLLFKLFSQDPVPTSDGELKLQIWQNDQLLSEQSFTVTGKSGARRWILPLQIGAVTEKDLAFKLAAPLTVGTYRFRAELSGTKPAQPQILERVVQIQSDQEFQTQLHKLSQEKAKLATQLNLIPAIPQRQHLNLSKAVIENCVQLATDCWQRRNPTAAFQALARGFQALARSPFSSGRGLRTPDFRLKWIRVTPVNETYSFGDTVSVEIDWQLQGQNPELNLIMRLMLLNEYGQLVTQTESSPAVPISQWQSGQSYRQRLYLRIPQPSSTQSSFAAVKSGISTGWHEIAIAIFEPPNANHPRPQPIWLDHPENIHFFPIGYYYTLSRIWVNVSQNRIWENVSQIQIRKLQLPPVTVGEVAPITMVIKNWNQTTLEFTTLIQLKTETGAIIFQDGRVTKLPGRQSTIQEFSWLADYAGNLMCEVNLYQGNQVLTQMERNWCIAWPPRYQIELRRRNSVKKTATNYYVPIELRCQHPPGLQTPLALEVEILGANKSLLQSSLPLSKTQTTEEFTLNPVPQWGYYQVHGTFKTPSLIFHFAQQIVATVVEIVNQTIVVNGEPFIIKGIDVQRLYPCSRSKTDQVLKLLKVNGFNTVAGKSPPRWQIELAHQNNLVWLVAPDFNTLTGDSLIFSGTNDTAGVQQEISRQYVLAHANLAGILAWNVGVLPTRGIAAQIGNLAPVYQIYDRYRRPVTCTNANAEVYCPGLDFLGVRAFFRPGQSTISQQPFILNSLRQATQRNLPIIVSAYNFAGDDGELSAARAIPQLWRENLNRGLAGGIFYPLEDEPGQFTGLIDRDGNLNIQPRLSESFQTYHADITLIPEKRNADTLFFRITNQRPFTIRQIEIMTKMRTGTTTYRVAAEILPLESITTILPTPTDRLTKPIILTGAVTFETHFGLKNQVNFQLFYPK